MNHCQLRNAAVRRHATMTKHRLNPNLMTLLDGEYPFGDRSMHGKAHSEKYVVLHTENPALESSCFSMVSQPMSVIGPPANDYGTVWTFDYWLRIAEEGPAPTGENISMIGSNGIHIGWMSSVSEIKNAFVRVRLSLEDQTYTQLPLAPLNNKQWVHIAATSDGRTVRVFYNGRLNAARQYNRPVFTEYANTRHNIRLGFLDELRMMRNECAWITNFTPPTVPYTGRERYFN